MRLPQKSVFSAVNDDRLSPVAERQAGYPAHSIGFRNLDNAIANAIAADLDGDGQVGLFGNKKYANLSDLRQLITCSAPI